MGKVRKSTKVSRNYVVQLCGASLRDWPTRGGHPAETKVSACRRSQAIESDITQRYMHLISRQVGTSVHDIWTCHIALCEQAVAAVEQCDSRS